jgi:hypothetical protein
VWRLLDQLGAPLSFLEICEYLGPEVKADAATLQESDFLDTRDLRLMRTEDGRFALRAWFDAQMGQQPGKPVAAPGEESRDAVVDGQQDVRTPRVGAVASCPAPEPRGLGRIVAVLKRVFALLAKCLERRSRG